MESNLWFGLDDASYSAPYWNALKEFTELKSKFTYVFSLRLTTVTYKILKFLFEKTPVQFKAIKLSDNNSGNIDYCTINTAVGHLDGCWFNIKNNAPYYHFNVFGDDEKSVAKLGKELQNCFNPLLAKDDLDSPSVSIDFYQMTSNGPDETTQKLLCPSWKDIEENYNKSILNSINKLLTDKTPWANGKLLIINGPPGCGKTYFIRSLLRAWRNILKPTVVLDPEEFSRNPLYYFSIANNETYEPSENGEYKVVSSKPRLLIMEDCADLIMTESRANHYDKVGKLLNMTDGLLGQGRNDVFLISFNEEIKDIDPAFRRPGRLLMSLEIPKLDHKTSQDWLVGRGHKGDIGPGDHSLAELYEKVSNVDSKIITKEKFGFSKTKKVGF